MDSKTGSQSSIIGTGSGKGAPENTGDKVIDPETNKTTIVIGNVLGVPGCKAALLHIRTATPKGSVTVQYIYTYGNVVSGSLPRIFRRVALVL